MILYKYQVASFPVVFLRKCLMLTWTIYARELSAALLLLFETRWFTHFVRNAQNLYGRFLPDLGISGLTSLMLSSWRGLSGPPDACLAQIWLYRHDDREYVTHMFQKRQSRPFLRMAERPGPSLTWRAQSLKNVWAKECKLYRGLTPTSQWRNIKGNKENDAVAG